MADPLDERKGDGDEDQECSDEGDDRDPRRHARRCRRLTTGADEARLGAIGVGCEDAAGQIAIGRKRSAYRFGDLVEIRGEVIAQSVSHRPVGRGRIRTVGAWCGIEADPSLARDPELDPGVSVVVSDDHLVDTDAVAGCEPQDDPGRDSYRAGHHCHRRCELLAVAPSIGRVLRRIVEQPGGEDVVTVSLAVHIEVVGEASVLTEPVLDSETHLERCGELPGEIDRLRPDPRIDSWWKLGVSLGIRELPGFHTDGIRWCLAPVGGGGEQRREAAAGGAGDRCGVNRRDLGEDRVFHSLVRSIPFEEKRRVGSTDSERVGILPVGAFDGVRRR